MKKTTVILLALCLGTTASLLPACNKQIPNQQETFDGQHSSILRMNESFSDEELLNMMSNVGVYHNDAMDTIYRYLHFYKESMISSSSNFTEFGLYDEIHDASTYYALVKWNLEREDISELHDFITTYNYDFFFTNHNYGLNYIEEKTAIELTDFFKSSVNSLVSIFDNNAFSTVILKQQAWDTLLYNVLPELENPIEKAAFIAGINTAKSTYAYWSNSANMNKWYVTLSETVLPDDPEEYTAKMSQSAKADMWGAIGGTIGALSTYGGLAWSFGPGAVVAVALCGAVHGASSGTALDAIKSTIESWFSW